MKIGYARVSTSQQDLTAQLDALKALGVDEERIYVDHGLTGSNRDRPGLARALAAVREGDTLVVTKLDRLARSIRDAHSIADELSANAVVLSIGTSTYDPTDPMGKLLFNVLAMVAEFEADIIRARTREGIAVARSKGKLRGKQPKLSAVQERRLVTAYLEDKYTTSELAAQFGVSRATVYRAVERAGVSTRTKGRPLEPLAGSVAP